MKVKYLACESKGERDVSSNINVIVVGIRPEVVESDLFQWIHLFILKLFYPSSHLQKQC